MQYTQISPAGRALGGADVFSGELRIFTHFFVNHGVALRYGI
jgi:hypothetical protein